jgi:hypothetical protein
MMTPSTKDLPGSGTIKLSEIKTEFGKGNNLLDYLGEGGVTSSAPVKLTDFYGASSGWDSEGSVSPYREIYNIFGSAGAGYANADWTMEAVAYSNSWTRSSCASDFELEKISDSQAYRVDWECQFSTDYSQSFLEIGLQTGDGDGLSSISTNTKLDFQLYNSSQDSRLFAAPPSTSTTNKFDEFISGTFIWVPRWAANPAKSKMRMAIGVKTMSAGQSPFARVSNLKFSIKTSDLPPTSLSLRQKAELIRDIKKESKE